MEKTTCTELFIKETTKQPKEYRLLRRPDEVWNVFFMTSDAGLDS